MSGESIFVIEDEGFVALQIKELLEKNGYHVTGIMAYGEEAIAMTEKTPPDLICMDINLMGKLDGIETAKKIREEHDIPIIFLTAIYDNSHLARAKETLPYSFIIKPYNDRELLASVEMTIITGSTRSSGRAWSVTRRSWIMRRRVFISSPAGPARY